ncbi:MAG: hypothetical protein ACD_63C00161G0001 [uncultured bacterium]|nr:MAG: hypothetical protein ACD_63C00161G0001 [uncultured bacterium]
MDNQNSGDRTMHKGNWTCSECGAEITELPFEPDGDRPIFCRECHQKKRDEHRGGGGGGQRRTFQGNWKCAECGTEITELPFEPRDEQSILCKECYMKQKNGR